MADIDHQRGVAAVAQDHLESHAATAATTSSVNDDDGEGDEGFTFATVPRLAAGGESFPDDGRIGPVYPVFGRPRSPPLQEQGEEEDLASSATVRVPLAELLLEERGSSSPGQRDVGGELDGVPADTYCLWSPGGSPAAAGSDQSPARCQKSGSTGSVLRWRRRLLRRSNSDGKEKFVYLNTISSERNADRSHRGRDAKGGDEGNGGRRSFLPYKKDLVGLFANAGAFRRSYHSSRRVALC